MKKVLKVKKYKMPITLSAAADSKRLILDDSGNRGYEGGSVVCRLY
jgi:hypothetical protein